MLCIGSAPSSAGKVTGIEHVGECAHQIGLLGVTWRGQAFVAVSLPARGALGGGEDAPERVVSMAKATVHVMSTVLLRGPPRATPY
eukprot:gene1185-4059_t